MAIRYKNFSAAASLCVATSLAVPALSATTIKVLAIGDSITIGSDSDTSGEPFPNNPDNDLGGYRFYLDRNLEALESMDFPSFDFVGNRSDSSEGITDPPPGSAVVPFIDNQHFGVSGSRAADDRFFDNGTDYRPSTLTAFDNLDYLTNPAKAGTDPTNAAFNSDQDKPDAVLLQIGINRLFARRDRDLRGNDRNTVQERIDLTVTRAVNGFKTLLDGDDGSDRGDGNTGPRVGLTSRLTDTTYFAEDAHLFVALILPQTRTTQTSGGEGTRDGELFKRHASLVADYNKRVKDELLSRTGPGGELEGRVTFVDLFSISLAELDLTALADEFFDGDEGLLRTAINPEAEGGTDETDYVDWVQGGEGFGFDEGRYDEGTLPLTEEADLDLLNPDVGGRSNGNGLLLNDDLHPTNLGYAIQAQVFANNITALEAQLVPEPSALALLAVGGLLMVGRSRRRA